ncbi:beta strand repeat-containing protein [Granulicella mallensis]|nr:choice-of-anchor Q domain-containing protein [Granulicella mallensis]
MKIVTVAICAAVGTSLSAQTVTVTLSTDAAATTTNPGDGPGQSGDLRYALLNATSGSTILFNCGTLCTITLNGPLPSITKNLTINGGTLGNVIISGNGTYRVFFVDTGTVELENLLIRNAVGKGGNGGLGHIACGGGGAGLGGGLFVNGITAPATVTVSDVYFSSDSAIGGNGCSASGSGDGGGGGGLGGNGGNGALASGTYVNGGGGGVLGPGANGSTTTLDGAAGGVGGGGGADENGNPGSAPGTGGAGYGTNSAGANGTLDAAGNGGFGGGGGGGVLAGGKGGFGGGGGGAEDGGGAGGVGGGGGGSEGGAGGTGGVVVGAITGGNGSAGFPFGNGSSGGGAAAGPDIFVNQGTLITVNSGTLGASATGGAGGSGAGSGTFDATPVFNYTGSVNGSTTKGPIATALTASAVPDFVVTSTADSGQGTLREALTNAADFGAGNVTFDPTVFATPQTITLASSLSVPSSTTITGATSGSGTTLTNLVTVSGGGSSSNFPVFSVASGVTNASISNLIIANGHTTAEGGGVDNLGVLTVTNTTFSNNYAGGSITGGGNGGGAIYTLGTLAIAGSTFTGNSSAPGGAVSAGSGTVTVSSSTFTGNTALGPYAGGAMFINTGTTVTITDSTFSGNSASSGSAGGIFNYGTLSVTNSILSGNTGGDCGAGGGSTCPINGSNGNLVGGTVALSSLGSYGGPTQTMVPLPGSPAICDINPSTATGTDQRGDPRTTSYGTATCQDSGAVESHYAISFTTDPAATEISGVAFPVAITLTESGSPFLGASESIPVTLSSGATLSGSPVSASTSTANGVASYSLTATNATSVSGLKLNAGLTLHAPTAVIEAQSASFDLNLLTAPVASAAFNPTTIPVGDTSRLTITVTNPNAVALTNMQYTDTLPSGITFVSFLAGTCGSFNVNGGTFSISEPILGANSSCSVAVQVKGNTIETANDTTSTITSSNGPTGAAATAALTVEGGLIWVINANGTLDSLSETGTQAGSAGTAGTVGTYGAVAFDNAGDVWAVANGTSAVTEFTSTGTVIAVPGNAAAGVNKPTSLAIDGLGQVWAANANNSVSVLSSTGTAVTPSTGYQGGGISTPTGIIIDNSGSVWIPNKGNNSVTKIIGGAAPVVTPTVTGTTNNTLGTRP